MWVKITGRTDCGYQGILANQPVAIRDLFAGDTIVFGPEHIARALLPEDHPLAPIYEKKVLVTMDVLSGESAPGFVYRQAPLDPGDSGWSIISIVASVSL